MSESQVACHAILIGIDSYTKSPLRGSARDILSIKQFLEGLPEAVQVHFLATIVSGDPNLSVQPSGSTSWPTYENVTSAIEKVTVNANTGDHVYIHFSGHGTRGEPQSQFSNQNTGDLALVLLDTAHDEGLRYLWGHTLAIALKAMVDRRLNVTVVLDCCFSASIYRQKDPSVRFLPFAASLEVSPASKLESFPEKGEPQPAESSYRDASMLPNWLINPDGYAIITASGPDELAREIKGVDGEIHGALSYFMLEIMKDTSVQLSFSELYSRLCTKLQLAKVQQHPVFYGNKFRRFFQNPISGSDGPTLRALDGGLGVYLQAGLAHGVCTGDVFLLSPLSSPSMGGIKIRAVVTRAGNLTSDLNICGDNNCIASEQKGWTVKPETKLLLKKYTIRLALSVSPNETWARCLEDASLLVIDVHSPLRGILCLSLCDNEYQIRNVRGERIVNLPDMRQNKITMVQVCQIIKHLADFELVRDLKTPEPVVRYHQSITASITYKEKEFDVSEPIQVKHEDKLRLIIKNNSKQAVYIFVYYLGSRWQVRNLLRATYESVPSVDEALGFTGLFTKNITMIVPSELIEDGHESCEDVLKVFVTSSPTAFDILELPMIGSMATVKEMKIEPDRSPKVDENWVVFDFTVRTSLK